MMMISLLSSILPLNTWADAAEPVASLEAYESEAPKVLPSVSSGQLRKTTSKARFAY